MQCNGINNQGNFPEGSTTYHDYQLFDKDGNEITLAEKLEYQLSDGTNIIVPWTSINPPAAPGEIEIEGSFNRVENGLNERILTVHAVHDGGDDIFQPIKYTLIDDPNVTKDSPS